MKNRFVRAALAFCFLLPFNSCSEVTVSDSFTAMDTFMTVKISAPDRKSGRKILSDVRSEIARLEKIFSVTDSESDVYKINSAVGNLVPVHAELKELFDFSSVMYKKTGGFFNPALYPLVREWGFTTGDYNIPSDKRISSLLLSTDFSRISVLPPFSSSNPEFPFSIDVPSGMMVDFGAVAKGFTGDRIISALEKTGISSAIIDFGGNVQTLGKKSGGGLWNVGIKSPWGDEVACAVKVGSMAVITSGGYEKFFVGEDGKTYIHIFDYRTGRPVENEIASVTVIAENGAYADALSTSLFAMGLEGAVDFWRKNGGFDFVIMTSDEKTNERQLFFSEGISGSFETVIPFEKVTVARLQG